VLTVGEDLAEPFELDQWTISGSKRAPSALYLFGGLPADPEPSFGALKRWLAILLFRVDKVKHTF
jgi:hypothetical protein